MSTLHRFRSRQLGALLLATSLGACATDSPPDPAEPAAATAAAAAAAAATPALPGEGEWGQVTLPTVDGPRTLTYQVEGGHAIHQGDLDLGPVADLYRKHARGGAVNSDLGRRWTNGIVHYRYKSGTYASIKTAVDAAIQHWEDNTPLRFIEVGESYGGNYILFENAPSDANYGGQSNANGMAGGEQTIKVKLNTSPNQNMKGVVIHEIGHAVGLWHEQARNDRDLYVTVKTDCIQGDKLGQFDKQSESLDLGPYDTGSIMHYDGWAFCKPKDGIDVLDIDSSADCKCATIIDDATGLPVDSQRKGLSALDINTIHRMYDEHLTVSEANDRFGAAVAGGDFDGDGYGDLAVGTPGEDSWGVVLTLKGDGQLLSWWQKLYQSQVGGANEANDRFGGAVAVGDFDGDGKDDLAVGANGEDVDGVIDAGAVFLYRGSASGLVPWKILTQSTGSASLNMVADAFGSALVAGDFDGDGKDELAVGAPLDATSSSAARAGAVFVYDFDGVSWVFKHKLAQNIYQSPLSGDRFGIALAAGKLDDGPTEDLVVGSPEDGGSTKGQGSVFVYRSGKTFWTQLVQPAAAAPALGDQFGAAVAIGDVDLNYRVDVVVGAPNKVGGRGRVFWFRGDANEPFGPDGFDTGHWFSQAALASDEAGDRFGCRLLAGRIDGDALDDIVIGSCGEDVGTAADAGAVLVWRGKAGAPEAWKLFTQSDAFFAANEANDHFGDALAFTDIDGNGDLELVVGAPDEAPELGLPGLFTQGPAQAGGVYLFGDGAQPFTSGISWFQETERRE